MARRRGGLASTSGFKTVLAPNGIIAILIGLLLPAVQRLDSSDLASLETALKSGGTLGFVMADGSVREAGTGRRAIDCEGYAYMTQGML